MENYPLVSISIINYNDRKFIFKAIESVVFLDYPNLEIIITDNNSTDGTREEIGEKILFWKKQREEIGRKYLHINSQNEIRYVKNDSNDGFGKPHNQAIKSAKGEFVLLVNSDAILTPSYIQGALEPFKDPNVAAVQGKLLRYDFEKDGLVKYEADNKLSVIDTTGLLMFKNRRIVCQGQGSADQGQFEEEREIFGVDGAVPIYRKSALEDVKMPILESGEWKVESGNGNTENGKPKAESGKAEIGNGDTTFHLPPSTFQKYEYFDEDFFMYKEDVDLAWRLRLYGWKSVYTPNAVAYHGRGSGDSMAKNYLNIIKERRKISNRAKYLSFKHQRLMQIKNDFPSLLFTKHFFSFIIKEIGAWVYMIIFERFTLSVLKDLVRISAKFLKKRKIVMKRKRVGALEMEKWFE